MIFKLILICIQISIIIIVSDKEIEDNKRVTFPCLEDSTIEAYYNENSLNISEQEENIEAENAKLNVSRNENVLNSTEKYYFSINLIVNCVHLDKVKDDCY